MSAKEPEVLALRESCGGATLHWRGRPPGDSLQGWYKSKTKARAAAKLLPDVVLFVDGRPVA